MKSDEIRGVARCHDCAANPCEPHKAGCDVERCSVCGFQRIQCDCEGHDPLFARWTGFWPGDLRGAIDMAMRHRSSAKIMKSLSKTP